MRRRKRNLSEFIAALAFIGAKIDRDYYPFCHKFVGYKGFIDYDGDDPNAEDIVWEVCKTYGLCLGRGWQGEACVAYDKYNFNRAFIIDVNLKR